VFDEVYILFHFNIILDTTGCTLLKKVREVRIICYALVYLRMSYLFRRPTEDQTVSFVVKFSSRRCVVINLNELYCDMYIYAAGGAVGWGTALQAVRSRGSNPNSVIGIFDWHRPSARTMSVCRVDSACNRNECQECLFWGVKAAGD
jgi:hypothetical protein